jgi:hypothetical protein
MAPNLATSRRGRDRPRAARRLQLPGSPSELDGHNQGEMPMSNFQAIASQDLNMVCGGDGQPPPQKVDGRDVIDVTKAATRSVLNPLSMLGNVPDAIDRVTRKDRVGNNLGDRVLDGFTGLFGIDPLKPRK